MQLMTKKVAKIENEVHQAMVVMYAETGKLLNYRQLRRDPKYSKEWNKSSANEFGRLSDVVGGRVKGTNTIKFIKRNDVPANCRKEKQNKNRARRGSRNTEHPLDHATNDKKGSQN